MADKKAEDKNVRKLTKLGRKSLGVTLPIEDIRALGWREKQKLSVKRVRGGFMITDWRSKK